jgi:hypothetical protein
METLVTTYALAALAVCAYAVRLGLGTRRLARRWRQLQSSAEFSAGNLTPRKIA